MVEIKPKDLYQFLLTECRYGYTRNNHLMPDGAYRHVEEYLPELLNADREMAINTAKQLVEECISMELIQFSDGIDDDHGNRSLALKFIAKMRSFVMDNSDDCCWMPYNWDQFKNQLALDNKRRYDVYEAEYTGYSKLDDEREFKLGRRINCCDSLSKNELMMFIGGYVCNSDSFTYRKYEKKPDWTDFVDSKSDSFREDYNKQILTKYVFDDIKKAVIVKRGDC